MSTFEITPWILKIDGQTFNFALTTKSDVKMDRCGDGMWSTDRLTVQDDCYKPQVNKVLA